MGSKKTKENLNPYEALANAIIIQAVKDYRAACRDLAGNNYRKKKAAKEMKDECLAFFQSKWFGTLTQVDPEYLIQKLDEEVEG